MRKVQTGGMIIAWRTNLFDLKAIVMGSILSVKLQDGNLGFLWWLSCVCGPSSIRGKEEFWTELNWLRELGVQEETSTKFYTKWIGMIKVTPTSK